MKLSQLDSSLYRVLSEASEQKKVAEFYIDNARFIVISGYIRQDKSAMLALSLQIYKEQQIIGQFQSEGQTYTIIQEKESANRDSLNLAKILTARELQIATLVAQGKSNKQIAKHLQISKWTVSTHLRRIFMKLRVDNRAAMVYSCFGIIQGCVAKN